MSDFTTAGGNAYNSNIARWDGVAWNAYSDYLSSIVFALELEDGNLYVGGHFLGAGCDQCTNKIARLRMMCWV